MGWWTGPLIGWIICLRNSPHPCETLSHLTALPAVNNCVTTLNAEPQWRLCCMSYLLLHLAPGLISFSHFQQQASSLGRERWQHSTTRPGRRSTVTVVNFESLATT